MDARSARRILVVGLFCALLPSVTTATGQVNSAKKYSVKTTNFIVEHADLGLARELAARAESYRKALSVAWLGEEMPNWSAPCLISVDVGPKLGAGGATSFVFDRGEVYGWRMTIQGSRARLLDSVLPHEITHMILASHFREPLPRWADEGAATRVEHISERQKHYQMLDEHLHSGRGIAFNRMFSMTEYPKDIMPLYTQGFSLTEYLIQQGGRRKYVDFVGVGMEDNDWSGALRKFYQIEDTGRLQTEWLSWVGRGHPPLASSPIRVASNTTGRNMIKNAVASSDMTISKRERPEPNLIWRVPNNGQNTPSVARANTPYIAPVVDRGDDRSTVVAAVHDESKDTTRVVSAVPSPELPQTRTTHAARPQPFEQPSQVILEWRKRP